LARPGRDVSLKNRFVRFPQVFDVSLRSVSIKYYQPKTARRESRGNSRDFWPTENARERIAPVFGRFSRFSLGPFWALNRAITCAIATKKGGEKIIKFTFFPLLAVLVARRTRPEQSRRLAAGGGLPARFFAQITQFSGKTHHAGSRAKPGKHEGSQRKSAPPAQRAPGKTPETAANSACAVTARRGARRRAQQGPQRRRKESSVPKYMLHEVRM